MSDTINSGGGDSGSVDTSVDTPNVESNEVTNEGEQSSQEVAPKIPNVRKLKIKVDGKDEDFDLNLDDEEGLKRHIQMSKAAQKRMNEAALTKRQAEDFIKMLQEDPVKVLTNPKLGVNFREIAEKYLLAQIQDEMMSPEEKRLREADRIIREREDADKKAKADAETRQMQELQAHYAQDYDKKIGEALSTSGLPKTPRTVKRMAELMHKNLQHGFDLEPAQLVEIVREDYINEMKELFGASEGDMLLKIMGDDVANKIRKADLVRLKGNGLPQSRGSLPQAKSETSKPMTKDQWREYIDKKARS